MGIKSSGGEAVEQVYLAFLLSRLANIPVPKAHKSRRVSDWIKSIIYTYLRSNDVLIPTSRELRRGLETHRVVGALTLEPMAGTYFNTVVCDFESLYPSCIDSFNLSFETVDCLHEECRVNKILEVGHHVCTRRRGFYSLLVGALKDLRIRWFKPLANNTSLLVAARFLFRPGSFYSHFWAHIIRFYTCHSAQIIHFLAHIIRFSAHIIRFWLTLFVSKIGYFCPSRR